MRFRSCLSSLFLGSFCAWSILAGEETRRTEDAARGHSFLQWLRGGTHPEEALPEPTPAPLPEPAEKTSPENQASEAREIRKVVVVGSDMAVDLFGTVRSRIADKLTLLEKLRHDCEGHSLTPEQIRDIAQYYTVNELVGQHYLLAYLVPEGSVSEDGTLTFVVSFGRIGTVTMNKDSDFRGRYYGWEQIRDRLHLTEGEPFNYADIYSRLYKLNTRPDLQIDTDIKGRMNERPKPQPKWPATRVADIVLTPQGNAAVPRSVRNRKLRHAIVRIYTVRAVFELRQPDASVRPAVSGRLPRRESG